MDTLNIEVLIDGTLKIDSGKISGPNHMNAEAFLREMARLGGAKQERKHKHGMIGAVVHAVEHLTGKAH